MPGCVLRVAGADFQPEKFLSRFPSANVSGRGTGLNIIVSECDGYNFLGQVEDASAFLQEHEAAIVELLSVPGVSACLDFGIWRKETPSQSVRVPASLATLAGRFGLEIEISTYAAL